MQNHYQQVLQAEEQYLRQNLKSQIEKQASPDYGGVLLPAVGITHGKSAAMAETILLYCNPDSCYYHDPELYRRARLMLDFTVNQLRPDGTMDLFDCNMNSGPDTAFSVVAYAKAYLAVRDHCVTAEELALLNEVKQLIVRCSDGVVINGFHTPNHRWVICAALALAYEITGNSTYRNRIDDYLIEGIDCNEDGEYAERSSGIYNVVNDYSLIIMAEYLNMPELLVYVERNLTMMLAYFDPDMSVFTGNSTRQDSGARTYGDPYFPLYLYMGDKTGKAQFLQMAGRLMNSWQKGGRSAPLCLEYYMLYPRLKAYDLKDLGANYQGEHLYKESGILRLVKPDRSLTLLRNQIDFLQIQTRDMNIFLRIYLHFFNERHFTAEDIVKVGVGEYVIQYSGKGKYYLPFSEYPGTSDWWQMDKEKRPVTQEMSLKIDIQLKEIIDGYQISISTDSLDKMPLKIQWNIRGADAIYTKACTMPFQPGTDLVIHEGSVWAKTAEESVQITPFHSQHAYLGYRSPALPPAKDFMHIYDNLITPVQEEFVIRFA